MSICNWIKNWRIKPKSSKSRWGVIIPHTQKAGGAESPSGINEYYYALEMVKHMPNFNYETRDNAGVHGAASRLIKNDGCKHSIECHKNAYNGKAKGFELLVLKNDRPSIKEAMRIVLKFKEYFPDRAIRQDGLGIKYIERGDRGFYSLYNARDAGMKVSILSEVFFIDNPDEYIEPRVMAEFWKDVLT